MRAWLRDQAYKPGVFLMTMAIPFVIGGYLVWPLWWIGIFMFLAGLFQRIRALVQRQHATDSAPGSNAGNPQGGEHSPDGQTSPVIAGAPLHEFGSETTDNSPPISQPTATDTGPSINPPPNSRTHTPLAGAYAVFVVVLLVAAGVAAAVIYLPGLTENTRGDPAGSSTPEFVSAISLSGAHVTSQETTIGTTKANGVFLTVAFTIMNASQSLEVLVSDSDFSLADTGGRRYEMSHEGTLAYVRGDESLIWNNEPFAPGQSTKGVAIFDVPLGFSPLSLRFKDGPMVPVLIRVATLTKDRVLDAITVWIGEHPSSDWPTIGSWLRVRQPDWRVSFDPGTGLWSASYLYWNQPTYYDTPQPGQYFGKTVQGGVYAAKPIVGPSSAEVVTWQVDDRTGTVLLRADRKNFFKVAP